MYEVKVYDYINDGYSVYGCIFSRKVPTLLEAKQLRDIKKTEVTSGGTVEIWDCNNKRLVD